ncbi:MAG: hypothetical protein A2931_03065 [Candidatus Niyogibacteria bacterium RIFCSPLOWO2_01_FULL_45_48]|uniref:Ada DNA repair metal-binding domain-containing protein n=2 Tax=Candidatus Niyogiibacteriota TaxID=1817912 RepID=A0A1G2EWD5_9BACT|nr:MAG: hypothetical protein A2835_00645 [Candidatus Niyogibacteria bacterium RIFCSPHIGHO2_01_FULL_45_28]OGZ30115.1 MAG: hypothetical protein A3J00_03705 [Candidatus Niyogibacteria bacterium RIFCSPLOWO2_02_FULL_45_13]OGZ30146.1 MAG: hypothetical protein A2931_03065 [Candidatus Niyogibacteria bacterium RIFCSPLOWO2_01_FULL_45_48]
MLSEKFNGVKSYFKENQSDFFIALSFLMIALIGFGLGRLSYLVDQKRPITIEEVNLGAVLASEALFVASKNGTAYYPPSCAGAGRIKEENKIWFSSQKEAESLGYKPASNCPGL